MKEITLNPDGVLNILDPRKTYVLEVNWLNKNNGPEFYGKKYYLPYKGQDYMEFRRIGVSSHFYQTYQTNHIQHLVDGLLKFIPTVFNESWTDPHVYEFSSLEEFNNWRENQ